MSLHTIHLTVPANTPDNAPVRVVTSLTVARLAGIQVLFPDGCLAAVGVRFLDSGQQIAPLSGWLHGNNEVITWVENRTLRDCARFTIEGYSLADDWPHTLEIRLMVERA